MLRDMGYFSLSESIAIEPRDAWWLTLLPLTTGIMLVDGHCLEKYLKSFRGDIIYLDTIAGRQGKNVSTKVLIRNGWHLMLTNLGRELGDVN